ncbi:phage-like protein [Peptoclostridium acidaminophilum DSM 3953]|uniref:Phage-like protein n=1 Tax=Peptoclostridium acidaminophilum DSM 3953 TaxID=1286171 RepID=W8T269_PEPAC|nr:phage tail tape measure protein [Peptoclostridium acidaminophilum]AHM55844.1 phage-like protein [Peptoclostridium acidaminophilum DSM 3953]NLI93505.1 phage tail tape measure protein [Peptococcaceae bacterium]
MANGNNTVVARVGLDDSGFQEGVSKIQRSLKVVQSEFAAASSKLVDYGKSTEGLKLKADSLNRQMELQKEKVAALARSYQESVEKKGADAKATENLKIKLNYANAELSKMQQELKATTEELKLKSSAWHKLSESMDKAGQKMKAVGDKISSVGKKLSTAVTLPLVGIGTAATKMAMDAVESENLFEVAMGGVADDARKWSEETSKALGLNAYNVRNNMATYNAMLTSMGLATDESLKMSEGLTRLSYDMASFYNLKPEEAFEKLKSGISGEAEPLKALGILVNDTTIKTYAYTHGIAKQGQELTEAQKVQARYGAIMEATKNAQGDLARTMDSPTNKLRIMKEQAQQIGIQFGQILIPILEKLIAVIKPLMDRFQGLSKEQQELIVKIALVAATVGPVVMVIGKVVSVVGTMSSAFGAISGAMAAAGGASGAVGAAIAAITGPVGIAIAAVAAFIAIFVLLFKNNENFRNSVITVWNQIKAIMAGVFEAIKTLIQAFVQVAGAIWQKYGADIIAVISVAFNVIASVVATTLNAIKNIIQIVTSLIKGDWQGVWEGIKNLTQNLWNGIQSVISGVLNLIKGIISVETGIVKNTITGAWNAVKSVTLSIWQGIKTAIETPINAARNTVKATIDAIVGFFRNLKIPEIKIPQIKLPHFALTGKFSLSPPQVPKLSVNWYSTGGIFSSPSVIGIGEAGTEAVVPVEKLDEIMAKALQKIGVGTQAKTAGTGIQSGNVTNNYDITINNPKSEAASDSTRRVLLRQSYGLG